MDLDNKLQMIINDADLKIDKDSAFEKLLKVLVNYGMSEQDAEQMIADCIDEQYELDKIQKQFVSIYRECRNTVDCIDLANLKKDTFLH